MSTWVGCDWGKGGKGEERGREKRKEEEGMAIRGEGGGEERGGGVERRGEG